MKKFIILTNEMKDLDHKITNEVVDELNKGGASLQVGFLPSFAQVEEVLNTLDLDGVEAAIVLGGDGTLIRCGRALIERKIPVLGINVGTLGYLCEVSKDAIPEACKRLLEDRFTIEPRMIFKGGISGKEEEKAVNDVVINRAGDLRILYMHLYVDDQLLNTYAGDGLIISTPTGSTGYSMSCGGPIIDPAAHMMVVTPIAPHSLISKSIVLEPESKIRVVLDGGKVGEETQAQVSFDGTLSGSMSTGQELKVETAKDDFLLLRFNKTGFLDIMRNKLMKGI